MIDTFVERFCQENKRSVPQIESQVYQQLATQKFEGNIRELKNIVEKAMIFCHDNSLDLKHFGLNSSNNQSELLSKSNLNLDYNENILIQEALRRCAHNQTQAAKLLGISRHALIRRLEKIKPE